MLEICGIVFLCGLAIVATIALLNLISEISCQRFRKNKLGK